MHSTIIALLATTVGFAAASPLAVAKRAECPNVTGKSAYYVCANNGFRGSCSVDPCAISWCPDFDPQTCNLKTPTQSPPPVSKPLTCTGTSPFYICANNGFRGACSVDPSALSWCPDYQAKTCERVVPVWSEKTQPGPAKNTWTPPENKGQNNPEPCAPGTGYYQVCGNGYRGCCKADACGQASPICPSQSW